MASIRSSRAAHPFPGALAGPQGMHLQGLPLTLREYRSQTVTNSQFRQWDLSSLDSYFLPESLADVVTAPPKAVREFIEDDNRGAILPDPIATLDGLPFYLSVKGIGSTIDPYSHRSLDRAYVSELLGGGSRRGGPDGGNPREPDRIITGELWLRGSPYGGQGLEHATTALAVSERADLTSIGGFRIAPVLKIAYLPKEVQEHLRRIHWYRRYPGPIVQELRLVPSNIRVYFHSRNTIGNAIRHVFDLYGIDAGWKAHRFETNFLRSGVAMLTLFTRSMRYDPARRRYRGLDFHDVWLDKDAVVAPDGTVYFVDLEGIDEVSVEEEEIREKVEDQIYRSLYELMFAYEQVDQERQRRFGATGTRKRRFEALLDEALDGDPYVQISREGRSVQMVIRNECQGGPMYVRFGMVDW